MKKQFLFILGAALMTLNACKEVGPNVDLTGPIIDTSLHLPPDTTYLLTTVPGAEPRRVLVEEATGVACVNCPAGAKILSDYEAAHPNSLIVLGLHAGALTRPLLESKYDFRTDLALQIYNFLGGEPNKPSASFDRIKTGSVYFADKGAWPNMINQRVVAPSAVNLTVTSEYNADKKLAIIRLKAIYTQATSKKQVISLAITEDKIVDAQDLSADGDSIVIHGHTYHAIDGVIEDYEHNHVLRAMIGPVVGSSVIDTVATKMPGRVFERAIAFKIPEGVTWNVNNLNIVTFISNNEADDKTVLQAVETKMK